MQHFFQIQNELISSIPKSFERFLMKRINFDNQLIGIIGARGVGKTTLILQYLSKSKLRPNEYLYVSLDDIYFSENSLVEFVDSFVNKLEGKLLVLDEIHKYKNWNQELKNVYDRYPELKVIFSGSSSIDLVHGNYDLSRRGIIYELPGLSFREYLEINEQISFENFEIEELFENHLLIAQKINELIRPLAAFNRYLRHGYYPYKGDLSEIEFFQKIKNTIEKTIQIDVARFYSLKTGNLQYLYRILYFLSTISPGKFSVNNLANHLGIAFETASDYLEYLRSTSLLRYLYIDASGSKLVRNAEKVFLDNTNLVFSMCSFLDCKVNKGFVRELFVLSQLQNAGLNPSYVKKGDLNVKGNCLEIGGKSNNWEQIKNEERNWLVKDDVVLGVGREIPLYLFGFLY